MKPAKVYDFTTTFIGGDIKGIVVLTQQNKTEEEAHKEIAKTVARLKAQYYETEKHDMGMMRMYIPKRIQKSLKEKVEE